METPSHSRESDLLFAALIVKQGLCSAERVSECIAAIEGLAQNGVSPLPSLSEILVQRGYLAPISAQQTMKLSPARSTSDRTASLDSELPPEAAGERVGKYVKARKLGEGGMGEVWKAWDTQLRRWVALKFLKGTDDEERARFRREAQTAAKLDHPNIAAVHEAQEEYIAMQFVSGQDLTEFPRDDARRLVDIVRQAALAVQFAHMKGIVHRDLKPANIMVEKDRIYVMDFGLSKSLSVDSKISVSGTIVGTPAYMSPEQARGSAALDHRTDIYSLGATLYEVLADRPPFRDPNVLALLDKVTHEDPAPLRNRDADINTIVLKCLEKDPSRRYATAQELAEELSRYLNGEAIRAHPPSAGYRIRKFFAKRKALTGLVAVAVAAIAVGGAFGISQLSRARRAGEAQRRSDARSAAVDRVLKRLNDARDILYDGASSPDRIHAAGREVIRDIDLVLGEFPDDARLHLYRGQAGRLLGDDAAAEMDFLKAVELDPGNGSAHYELGWLCLERILVADIAFDEADRRRRREEARKQWLPQVEERFHRAEESGETADREKRLARLWRWVLEGKAADARRECDDQIAQGGRLEAVYLLRGILQTEEKDRLADFTQAVLRAPNEPRYRFNRGACRMLLEDFAGAIEDYTRAIEIRGGYAEAYCGRGLAKEAMGRFRDAIDDFTRAIEIRKDYAEAYGNRGVAKAGAGDSAGAMEDYSRAIEIKKNYAEAYSNRGLLKGKMGDARGAIDDYTRAIEVGPDFAAAYVNRARERGLQGAYDGAIDDCTSALRINPDSWEAYANRAWAKGVRTDYAGAIEDYTSAIRLKKDSAEAYCGRGVAREKQGDDKGAIDDFTHAVKRKTDYAEAYYDRGLAKRRLGDTEGAIKDYTRAIEFQRDYPEAYFNRGAARSLMGDKSGAILDFRKALEVAPPSWPYRDKIEKAIRALEK